MKKSLRYSKKLLKAVEEYAANRGKGSNPLIELAHYRRNDYRQWMGNAVMASYHLKEGRLSTPSKSFTYCSNEFFSSFYKKNEYIFIQVQDIFPDLEPEAFWAYIEWIVNDSPWASAFMTKNINTIKRRKVVVMYPNDKKWFVLEAAIALRQCWENYCNNGYYKQIGLWYELSKGIDKRVAYIAARPLTKVVGETVMFRGGDAGHTPINLYLGQPISYLPYSGWIRGRKFKDGWDIRRPRKVVDTIVKVIKEGPNSEQKKKVNPFPGAQVINTSLNRSTFIERLTNGAKEIEEAINA